jgi:hypothetical protein
MKHSKRNTTISTVTSRVDLFIRVHLLQSLSFCPISLPFTKHLLAMRNVAILAVRVGTCSMLLIALTALSVAPGIVYIAPFCKVAAGAIVVIAVAVAGNAFEIRPGPAKAHKIFTHVFTGFSVKAIEALVPTAECAAVSHHHETLEQKHHDQHTDEQGRFLHSGSPPSIIILLLPLFPLTEPYLGVGM